GADGREAPRPVRVALEVPDADDGVAAAGVVEGPRAGEGGGVAGAAAAVGGAGVAAGASGGIVVAVERPGVDLAVGPGVGGVGGVAGNRGVEREAAGGGEADGAP